MSNFMLHFVRREGAERYPAFRVTEWFDASASEARFGVQAQVSRGKWCHIAYQGAPLIFRDRIDAADEVSRLRKASKANQAEAGKP
jgi:hypothetical protein